MSNKKSTNSDTKTKRNPKTLREKLFYAIKILALPVWVTIALLFTEYSVVFGLYFLIGREQLSTPVWTTVANALVYSIAVIIIIFLPPKLREFLTKHPRKNPSREELGLKNLPTWTDILLAPAGFIAYFILGTIIVYLFSFFPFFDPAEAQDVGYSFLSSGLDRMVAFLALVIIAPIAEEIIFRGWLYGKLRKTITGKLSLFLSILITSLLFGIMHGQWNVGVNVFAMSIVLCLMREMTGTIYAGILLHMIKNGLAFVLLYILNVGL